MCPKSSFTTPAVAAISFYLIGGTSAAPAYADFATLDRIELDHVQYGDLFDGPTGAQLGMTLTGTAVAGATFIFTDTPYLSAGDSPFDLFGPGSDFRLEDFEDGLLNSPGLLGFGGEIRFPGPFTDSVDADDGIIDGFGLDGHDFWAFAHPKNGPLARFEFDPKVLGGLPRSVGVVWTDGNSFATTFFEAFGPNGESLGVLGLVLGEEKPEGGTIEDRFVGIVFEDGISAIEISVPAPTCPWDLDIDGSVGVKDLLFLLGVWGPCPKQGACPADFDNSGAVDVKDLLFLLGAWGPCPGGDECKGQTCDTFTFDCNPDNPACACVGLFDGSGLCVVNWDCTGIECPDGTCPPGFVCVVNSCCGDTTCAPIEFLCSANLSPPVFKPGTQTGLGDGPE